MKEEKSRRDHTRSNPQTVDAGVLLAAEAQAVDDVEKDVYEGHDSRA